MDFSTKLKNIVLESINEMYGLERLKSTFQPHINPAYDEDFNPTGLEVVDKYNPRSGSEYVDWNGAVSEEGKIWSRSDPNFDEERLEGNAWLIEDVISAISPYVKNAAKRLYNKYRDSHYVSRNDVDTIYSEMLYHIIENTLGRNSNGNWQDQGKSPYIYFAIKRAVSMAENALKSGKISGNLRIGRDIKYSDAGHQHSLSSPTKSSEGEARTIADIVGAGAGEGWSPSTKDNIKSRLSIVPSATKAELEELEELYDELSDLYSVDPEFRDEEYFQDLEDVKEELKELKEKIYSRGEYGEFSKAKEALEELMYTFSDFYSQKINEQEFKNNVTAYTEIIKSQGEPIINEIKNSIKEAIEYIREKSSINPDDPEIEALSEYTEYVDELIAHIRSEEVQGLSPSEVGILKTIIDRTDFSEPERIVLYLTFSIDMLTVEQGEGYEPIYHPETNELIGYKPPEEWRDILSTKDLADPESMTSLDYSELSGKSKNYIKTAKHMPKAQRGGKFGRKDDMGGETRGVTEIANIVNKNEDYYNTFLEEKRIARANGKNSYAIISKVDIEKVERGDQSIDPSILHYDHIVFEDDQVWVVKKTHINHIRNEAYMVIKPQLEKFRDSLSMNESLNIDNNYIKAKVNNVIKIIRESFIRSFLNT